MGIQVLVGVSIIAVVLLTTIIVILSRYRKCPSDKVLVIYGKVGSDKNGVTKSARCIHGGAAFIIPVLQAYQYMDLTPISISVDLKNRHFQNRTSVLMYLQDLLSVFQQNPGSCKMRRNDCWD